MKIEVIKSRKKWLTISGVLVGLSLLLFLFKGLNYGIDFTGGNIFQLEFSEIITMENVQNELDDLENKYDFLEARRVQISEDNVLMLRTAVVANEIEEEFLRDITSAIGNNDILMANKVGAVIGKELQWKAINALLIGSLIIVCYITLRFEFRFAVGAIAALLHDVILALGILALLGLEINTPFIAAILTILGYSINDSIVVFDRIRENLKKMEGKDMGDVITLSLNQIITRTINTSLTTLFAIIALLLFGGATLQTFTATLLIGVIAGTYSSIFVASPIVYLLEKENKHVLEKK